MVELPEPDYHTLEEAAERWGVSKWLLFRLRNEGKLQVANPRVMQVYFLDTKEDDWRALDEGEIKEIAPPGTEVYPERSREEAEAEIETLKARFREDSEIFSSPALPPAPPTVFAEICYLNPENIGYLDNPKCIHTFTGATFFLDENLNRIPASQPLPCGVYLVPVMELYRADDLVIPITEIHRIERQHEAAENAAKDDVLGTKEKETLQAVIAAMTQIIASTKNKYKHGNRPNADAIATDLEGMIPDRTKRGISETIRNALKAGLIRT